MNPVIIGDATLYLGDCLENMKSMPDNSIDSIVTDPPYGLSFMGKKWDYDVPSEAIWRECLRVLKPGGHLLAFAGTRTQHRMAVRIEDAGFEIRDMIAWVYGSGFPKSLDASKAIDKAAGKLKAQSVGFNVAGKTSGLGTIQRPELRSDHPDYKPYTPATDAARQWEGWGTALKPALETVTFASKPYTDKQERDIIQSNLFRLEARLWLLSPVSAAVKSSTSSQSEFDAACVIAQWSADEITSTQAALCDPMGTSLFELATTTSLNIVSSWRGILDESWSDGNTSTTETKLSMTIDWRTLKFSLSQITPASIIKACSLPGGFSANASTAENHFNASLSLLQSIRTLSATEPAISQEAENFRGADVKPNLDPCIMARKPLIGTVAENVLTHGTGALNIDGCRVAGEPVPVFDTVGGRKFEQTHTQPERRTQQVGTSDAGRWPANLIHNGSDEVLAAFPQSDSPWVGNPNSGAKGGRTFGGSAQATADKPEYRDTGSAARFFYCAKASKRDRDEGLEGFEDQTSRNYRTGNVHNGHGGRVPDKVAKNIHPTVKPTDLMRYLCRLVTPPGGVVLDPFMGSGSTGKAAVLEGFRFIGIEREAEYLEIARARIQSVQSTPNQPTLL